MLITPAGHNINTHSNLKSNVSFKGDGLAIPLDMQDVVSPQTALGTKILTTAAKEVIGDEAAKKIAALVGFGVTSLAMIKKFKPANYRKLFGSVINNAGNLVSKITGQKLEKPLIRTALNPAQEAIKEVKFEKYLRKLPNWVGDIAQKLNIKTPAGIAAAGTGIALAACSGNMLDKVTATLTAINDGEEVRALKRDLKESKATGEEAKEQLLDNKLNVSDFIGADEQDYEDAE